MNEIETRIVELDGDLVVGERVRVERGQCITWFESVSVSNSPKDVSHTDRRAEPNRGPAPRKERQQNGCTIGQCRTRVGQECDSCLATRDVHVRTPPDHRAVE